MFDGISGEKIEGFSYSTSSLPAEGREQNNGLIMQDYHFSEGNLPRSIDIEVIVEMETFINSQDERVVFDEVAETEKGPIIEEIGTFRFHIDFEKFGEPITYVLNENQIIMGQEIIVEDMVVYPTGTEVTFRFPKENTAWIKGLELEVEQTGDILYKGSNGISGTHDEENNWMRVYIESNYFEEPKKQELVIKGIRLLDKEEEFITIDLDNKTINPVIDGTELQEVIKHSGKADLIFSTITTNDDSFGMFSHQYKDEEGNYYEYKEEGSYITDSLMKTKITVEYPVSGKIILQRSLTPKLLLEEPIRISLPLQE
jgi:hypothetical protein